jgi:hypothetical protein
MQWADEVSGEVVIEKSLSYMLLSDGPWTGVRLALLFIYCIHVYFGFCPLFGFLFSGPLLSVLSCVEICVEMDLMNNLA